MDQYSAITVAGGQSFFVSSDTLYNQNISVQAWHFNSTSPNATYINVNTSIDSDGNATTTSSYMSLFSAVVSVLDGKIISVAWDNGCYFCDYTTCVTDSTGANCPSNGCFNTNITATSCDPKVYVSWFGTDKNGYKLTSSGLRFSRFTQFSVTSLINDAQNVVDTSVADSKANYNCVTAGTCNSTQSTSP